MGQAQSPQITPVRRASLCRFCRRELVIQQVRARDDAKFRVGNIVLRCPKHGVLGRHERYLTGFVSS